MFNFYTIVVRHARRDSKKTDLEWKVKEALNSLEGICYELKTTKTGKSFNSQAD